MLLLHIYLTRIDMVKLLKTKAPDVKPFLVYGEEGHYGYFKSMKKIFSETYHSCSQKDMDEDYTELILEAPSIPELQNLIKEKFPEELISI